MGSQYPDSSDNNRSRTSMDLSSLEENQHRASRRNHNLTCPINSLRRRCSVTSVGRESNCSSSAFIRQRRFPILFPAATDSWKCVCQGGIPSKRAQANLVICIKTVEDGPQGGLKGTELFCVIPRAPRGCFLASCCHGWYVVNENQHYHDVRTYPWIRVPVRYHLPQCREGP